VVSFFSRRRRIKKEQNAMGGCNGLVGHLGWNVPFMRAALAA
jgi:hypothetical protein